MVNRGPSSACGTCRKRRVKCDLGRPSCQNCKRRGHECAGYEGTFHGRYRNQLPSILKRINRKQGAATQDPLSSSSEASTKSSPSTAIDSTDAVDAIHADSGDVNRSSTLSVSRPLLRQGLQRATLPLLISPSQDLIKWSTQFFFAFYTNPGNFLNAATSAHYQLFALYENAPLGSPIHYAIQASAVNITMLWSGQGSDTIHARRLYSQAVTAMRQSLIQTSQKASDDVVMTAILLHFYDLINSRYWPKERSTNGHLEGALAMLQVRGSPILQTDAGRSFVAECCRLIVRESLQENSKVPANVQFWLDNPAFENQIDLQLERISIPLAQLQDRFYELQNPDSPEGSLTDTGTLDALLEDAYALEKQYIQWKDKLPPDWQPALVAISTIDPKIREAGAFGKFCSLYTSLSIAFVMNLYRSRRLRLLHIIRTCHQLKQASPTSLGDDGVVPSHSEDISTLIQEVVETVPFFLGNATKPVNPLYSHEVSFPYLVTGTQSYPRNLTDHARHAVSYGGTFLLEPLFVVLRVVLTTNPNLFESRFLLVQFLMSQITRARDIFKLSAHGGKEAQKKSIDDIWAARLGLRLKI